MPKPVSDAEIRRLSAAQRNLLIDHIDGPVDVSLINRWDKSARRGLISTRLLEGHPRGSIRPRQTTLTERGREALGMVLGDYADALVRAGLLEQQNPLAVLRRLKTMRAFPTRSGDTPNITPESSEMALKRA